MEDHEFLQHLLSLEKEASTLVYEAQEEADRRIADGEKQHRARYEEVYAREVEFLESNYAQNYAAIKENYRQQLELYRESLKTQPLDMKAFSSLAEKYLINHEE